MKTKRLKKLLIKSKNVNNDKLLTFLRVDNEIIEKKMRGEAPNLFFQKFHYHPEKTLVICLFILKSNYFSISFPRDSMKQLNYVTNTTCIRVGQYAGTNPLLDIILVKF